MRTPAFQAGLLTKHTLMEIKMQKLNTPFTLELSTDNDANFISDEIMHYNALKVPFTQKETPIFIRYVIKVETEIIAGINTVLYHWGMLSIEELFIAEAYRFKKLGSYLINKVEKEAIKFGATLAHTDTFDFQAKDFYLKNGYEVFGELKDCPPGHTRFYLKKCL